MKRAVVGVERWWVRAAAMAVLAVAGTMAESAFAQGPPPDPARRAELLKKFDKDGDGRLSPDEIAAARAARAARGSAGDGARRAPAGEKRADAASGLINDAAMQALLERFDADRNGRLDYEEMAALRAARRAAPENRGLEPRARGTNAPRNGVNRPAGHGAAAGRPGAEAGPALGKGTKHDKTGSDSEPARP